jgi:capsid protein
MKKKRSTLNPIKRETGQAAQSRVAGLNVRKGRTKASSQVARLDSECTVPTGLSVGYYDAATLSQTRSALINFPLTARREITPYVRSTVLRKLRELEANLGIIQRMKGQVGKYSVGFGIFPVPQTTDTEWNELARAGFMDWGNNPGVCDVAGAMTFWERQRFHAETFFAENESFDALVSSSVSGAPQLQLFDNSEIGNGLFGNPNNDPAVIDGVRVNAQNRIISYLVATQNPMTTFFTRPEFAEIAAADMIHIVRRKRANQLRGISPFAPAINTAIDVMDLDAVINVSAKLHNAMGITVNKRSGEAGKKGITGQVRKMIDGDGKVTQVDEKFIRGAMIQYLGLDEEIKIVSSDRPTENLLNYLVYRLRHICITTGLPFEIVWDMATLGGATARIALADAQWFFDLVQDTINDRLNQRVWVWKNASDMKNGVLRECTDPRWWNCHWQGPAKLTADEGYSAQAQIDRLYSGQDNWQNQYARKGAYWKPGIIQRLDELAFLNEEAAKRNVDPNLVFAPKPGTVVQVHGQQNSATD